MKAETDPVASQALERVPSDIRRDGGVARMSDPQMIKEIMAAVSIPVSTRPASSWARAYTHASIRLWLNRESATSSRLRSSRLSVPITSTSLRSSPLPTPPSTSTSTISQFLVRSSFCYSSCKRLTRYITVVCGCKNLGEALRRISEGAAMIRTKGESISVQRTMMQRSFVVHDR